MIYPIFYFDVIINIFFVGKYRERIPVHAETDRVRRSGRRNDDRSPAQQQTVARETHHCVRDRDICEPRPDKKRTKVRSKMLHGVASIFIVCSGSVVVTAYDFESARVRILSGG